MIHGFYLQLQTLFKEFTTIMEIEHNHTTNVLRRWIKSFQEITNCWKRIQTVFHHNDISEVSLHWKDTLVVEFLWLLLNWMGQCMTVSKIYRKVDHCYFFIKFLILVHQFRSVSFSLMHFLNQHLISIAILK